MPTRTVWKFPLTSEKPHFPANKIVEVELPADAQLLSLRTFNNTVAYEHGVPREEFPVIWVLTKGASVPKIKRKFLLLGTGEEAEIPSDHLFFGTYLNHDSSLVNHVFVLPFERCQAKTRGYFHAGNVVMEVQCALGKNHPDDLAHYFDPDIL